MKAFASWSGGKDCMFALHKYLNNSENTVHCLVNMCDSDNEHSRSHGIKKSLIEKQAKSINIPIIQKNSNFKNYRENLKSIILELKKEGVDSGIFGDIYLNEHRVWIEKLCKETDIKAIFPLWKIDTKILLKDFIDEGFKTIVVAINNTKLDTSWLGRVIDNDFYNDIIKLDNIDPCAEKGEFHTFVYDGPLFNNKLELITGKTSTKDKNSFIEIILKN